MVKQTWLCKKTERYAALKIIAPKGEKQVRFEVVETNSEKGLGFDPEAFSKAGNATCPFCGTVADSSYVKAEGQAGRMSHEMMAVACAQPGRQGKVYLSANDFSKLVPNGENIRQRIKVLCSRTGLTVPSEPIINDAKSARFCVMYGLRSWGDLFTPRQMLCLLTFTTAVREAYQVMVGQASGPFGTGQRPVPLENYNEERAKAIATYLGMMVDKLSDFCSMQCVWNYTGGRGVKNSFGRQALPMTWDFSETNPFNPAGASWVAIVEDTPAAIEMLVFGQCMTPMSDVARPCLFPGPMALSTQSLLTRHTTIMFPMLTFPTSSTFGSNGLSDIFTQNISPPKARPRKTKR